MENKNSFFKGTNITKTSRACFEQLSSSS